MIPPRRVHQKHQAPNPRAVEKFSRRRDVLARTRRAAVTCAQQRNGTQQDLGLSPEKLRLELCTFKLAVRCAYGHRGL